MIVCKWLSYCENQQNMIMNLNINGTNSPHLFTKWRTPHKKNANFSTFTLMNIELQHTPDSYELFKFGYIKVTPQT